MAYKKSRYGREYGYGYGYGYNLPRVYRGYPAAPALARAYRSYIASLEDRRLWNPEPFLPPAPASQTRAARRLVIMPRRRSPSSVGPLSARLTAPQSVIGAAIGFAQPSRVAICVRRHSRREVLFAKGVGGSKVRRGKRNPWSEVQC